MELDWSALQTEAKSAGVIPAGEYNVVVTEATATHSSNGKPMIKYKAKVLDGPQANKPIWSQLVVSAESAMALRMFFLQMEAFGFKSDYFAANPALADVAAAMVNRGAVFTLAIRQWNGQDRNEVQGVKAFTGPTPPGVQTGPVAAPSGPRASSSSTPTATPVGSTPTTPVAGSSGSPVPPSSPATPF